MAIYEQQRKRKQKATNQYTKKQKTLLPTIVIIYLTFTDCGVIADLEWPLLNYLINL